MGHDGASRTLLRPIDGVVTSHDRRAATKPVC